MLAFHKLGVSDCVNRGFLAPSALNSITVYLQHLDTVQTTQQLMVTMFLCQSGSLAPLAPEVPHSQEAALDSYQKLTLIY